MIPILQTVVQLFQKHSAPLPPETISLETMHYMQAGLIDSISFVKMIVDLEETFHITFSQSEMSVSAFQSLAGIADIIQQKIAQQ